MEIEREREENRKRERMREREKERLGSWYSQLEVMSTAPLSPLRK